MQKWEYKILTVDFNERYIEVLLDEMGALGWELVAWNGLSYIFKRPL